MGEAAQIQPTEETTNVVIARGVAQVIDYISDIPIAIAVVYIIALTVNPVVGVEWVLMPLILLILAYNTLLEAYWNGQTIGKRITGIKVADLEGADPSLKQALIRNIPAAIPIGGHWQSLRHSSRWRRLISVSVTSISLQTRTSSPNGRRNRPDIDRASPIWGRTSFRTSVRTSWEMTNERE